MTLFEVGPEQAPTSAPRGPTSRVRLLVAYDGSGFRGFAEQPGMPTVAGALREALRMVLQADVELTCAGRTDAGVHAWGQVVSLDVAERTDLDGLARRVTKLLRPAIVVRAAEPAAADFDARFSAAWRTYRYTVLNRPVPDPFQHHLSWHVPQPLDLRAMRAATDPFLGEHDFASFCRRQEGRTTLRRVLDAGWVEAGDGVLRFEIRATAFCQQMVRSIVGTLVDVGLGTLRAGDIAWIIRAGDRSVAGQVAPPHGLCLWEVGYP